MGMTASAAQLWERDRWVIHIADSPVYVRPLDAELDIPALTALLHRAYKQLADLGFQYVASIQDEDVTLSRATKGQCFVATLGSRLVGTITLYEADQTSGCRWYDRDDVGHFGQFAVDPDLQGRGLGGSLLALVEGCAVDSGLWELALNTADGADHLIHFYERRGYRFIESVPWGKNYASVILSKTLISEDQKADTAECPR
jgi:GNAT superfamily N-acetyltransferase